MKLQPLNDEILVRKKEEDRVTKGGIFIPGNAAQEHAVLGEVLAISEGILLENGTLKPHSVAPGDVVMFDTRATTEVKVDGESLLLMRSLSLLAKVVQEQ